MSQLVEIHAYRTAWPLIAAAERQTLSTASGNLFVALEHIGSTAVPGLAAKPIIDLMGGVERLSDVAGCIASLEALGFEHISTNKPRRLLLRRAASIEAPQVHLHIVEAATWEQQNERLFRDFLRGCPEHAATYAALKQHLAAVHAGNMKAYTSAKTSFIKAAMVAARNARPAQASTAASMVVAGQAPAAPSYASCLVRNSARSSSTIGRSP